MTVAVTDRPSAKVTVVSSPRRLWALVTTDAGADDDAGATALGPADPDHGGAGRGQDPAGDFSKFIE